MEDKHTPEEVIKGYNSLSMIATKQWITKRVYNRLYVSIPIDNSTNHHAIAQVYDEQYAELIARAPELLEQVAALTKENDFHRKNESDMVKALTEQVEKLKEDLSAAYLLVDIGREELSRLRANEKELVEALKVRLSERLQSMKVYDYAKYEVNWLKSLLSKFEVPNENT